MFLTNITLCSRNKHIKKVRSFSYVISFGPSAKPSSHPYKIKSLEKDHYLLLEKLTGFRPVKKIAVFYGTRSFITAFAGAPVQFRGFVTRYVLRRGVGSTSPNHQFGRPQHVGCPRLLIRSIPQPPSILEAVPPSSTSVRAMSW